MSSRDPAPIELQPKEFSFNKENLLLAQKEITKYPSDRAVSAIKTLLFIAQNQHDNWVPIAAMDYIGKMLNIPYIKVYEIATFYTMFNIKPVGKFHIQLCGTTPCWLRGSDELKTVCKNKLKIDVGDTSSDNLFTLSEVECLGSCSNAPMVQINDDYYEDLNPENFIQLLDDLANNKKVKIGSQTGRTCSAPVGGLTTLKEVNDA